MNAPTNMSAHAQSGFDRALGDYLRARDSLNAMPVETTSAEDETIAMDAMDAAQARVFKAEPESLADVRALAELTWQEPASQPSEELIEAVLAGIRKFAPGESRTFNAKTWLHYFTVHGGSWVNVDGEVKLLSPVPSGETLNGLLWELRTRGGEAQVKAVIMESGCAVSAEPSTVSGGSEWERLRADYEAAAVSMQNHIQPRGHAFGSAENDAYEAETERLANIQADAFDQMMLHPAPDPSALAYKLTTQSAFLQGDNWHKGAEIAAQLAADGKRLLSGEA